MDSVDEKNEIDPLPIYKDDKLLFEGPLLNYEGNELDHVDDIFNQFRDINQNVGEIQSANENFLKPEDIDAILTSNDIALDGNLEATTFPASDNFLDQLEGINFVDVNAGYFENLNPNWVLLPIPENLQNHSVFHDMMSVTLDQSLIEKLNSTVTGYDGIQLPSNGRNLRSQKVVVRPPLQCVQEIIELPSNECEKENIGLKKRKRKQSLENFPREDGVMFIDVEAPPSPEKKIKLEPEPEIPVSAAISKVRAAKEKPKQKCPHCKFEFKRIKLHRCKEKPEIKMPKNVKKPDEKRISKRVLKEKLPTKSKLNRKCKK